MPRTRSTALTEQQRRFADAYFTSLNVLDSLAIAGYKGNYDALRRQGHRLLNDDRVQAYLQSRREKVIESTDRTLVEVIDQLKAIAFCNIKDFATWTSDGVEFIDSDKLDRTSAYAIKKIKGKKRPSFDKQGNAAGESLEFELELCNKEQALKILATYYGIDSDWNSLIAGLARFGLVLKEDTDQPSGWRVDRLEKS